MFRLAYGLLFLLLTYQFIVQATNSPNIFLREEPCSNLSAEGPPKRTLFNIVWGCFSTMIICTWLVPHPNIPPYERPLKRVLRRLELMFWTILSTEFLSCWALNQRLAAMTARDIYNGAKGYKEDGIWKRLKGYFSLSKNTGPVNPAWTLKHGYLLIMGGIHLVEPGPPELKASLKAPRGMEQIVDPSGTSDNGDTEKGQDRSEMNAKPTQGRVTILTLEMLEELVLVPGFEIPLTEAQIARTSKNDRLYKAIFILQSSWFILQCIARRVQGLDLTTLELTTLAFAVLNGIAFILWWDKPFNPQTIMRVTIRRTLTDEERDEERGNFKMSKLIGFPELFENRLTAIRDVLCQAEGNIFVNWLIVLPMAILRLLLSAIIALSMTIVYTIMCFFLESPPFPVDATHVPMFHAPGHEYSPYMCSSIFSLLAILFHGIPFAALTQDLPRLWRVPFLGVISVTPIGVFLSSIIAGIILGILFSALIYFFRRLGVCILAVVILTYACARFLDLGSVFASLRDLPPSAFIAVDWSKFYSHFF